MCLPPVQGDCSYILTPRATGAVRPSPAGPECKKQVSTSITKMFAYLLNSSLDPRRFRHHFKNVIFNPVLLIGVFKSYYNDLRGMPQNFINDKSMLVQVMAHYCQATRHNLSQCWLSSLLPYGITRPQWVSGEFKKMHLRMASAKCHPFVQAQFVE